MTLLKQTLTLTLLFFMLLGNAYATNSGPFLGAEISYNDVETGKVKIDYNNVGAGISFGYNFRLYRNFLAGLEIQGNYLGEFNQGNIHVFDSSLLLSATAILSELVDTTFKAGVSQEYLSSSHVLHIYSSSHLAPTIGASLNFQLTSQLDLNLEYTYIFGQSVNAAIKHHSGEAFSYNAFAIGLSYYFEPKHKQLDILMVPVNLDNITFAGM